MDKVIISKEIKIGKSELFNYRLYNNFFTNKSMMIMTGLLTIVIIMGLFLNDGGTYSRAILYTGIAGLAIILLLIVAGTYYTCVKAFSSGRMSGKPFTFTITSKGIILKNASSDQSIVYKNFALIIEGLSGFYFYLNKKDAVILPKKCLSEDEINTVRRIMSKVSDKTVVKVKKYK